MVSVQLHDAVRKISIKTALEKGRMKRGAGKLAANSILFTSAFLHLKRQAIKTTHTSGAHWRLNILCLLGHFYTTDFRSSNLFLDIVNNWPCSLSKKIFFFLVSNCKYSIALENVYSSMKRCGKRSEGR